MLCVCSDAEMRMEMIAFEKKLVKFCEEHLDILVVGAITLLSIMIRSGLRNLSNMDVEQCLLPWYNDIRDNGGFRALGQQVGTYNILYQTVIAILTYIPADPVYAYKFSSAIFDYLLAVTVGMLVYRYSDGDRKWKGIFAYAAVVLSPLVILNSAAWAQCDSVYAYFAMLALVMLCKEKYVPACIFLGVSLAFKLQAVFILPLFLFVWFWRRRFTIFCFLVIPVTMCVVNLPGVIMGRSFLDVFTIYLDQTDEYPVMVQNYPSVWLFLTENYYPDLYWHLKRASVLLTVAVLLLLMTVLLLKKVEWNPRNLIYIAFLVSYICVLFLPAMHERYGFLHEILAIIILIWMKRTIVLLVPMYCLTTMTYASFLFGKDTRASVTMTLVNLAVFLAYLVLIVREMDGGQGKAGCLTGDAGQEPV